MGGLRAKSDAAVMLAALLLLAACAADNNNQTRQLGGYREHRPAEVGGWEGCGGDCIYRQR